MITTEQTRETVNRLGSDVENLRRSTVEKISQSLGLSLIASRELLELVVENRRRLSKGEIDSMQFGKNEAVELGFLSKWIEDSLTVLRLVDAFSEFADSQPANQLRALVRTARDELQTRADSQRGIDAFIAKHSIPVEWNAELVERNMEAVARGEGIDVRDYLASLPR